MKVTTIICAIVALALSPDVLRAGDSHDRKASSLKGIRAVGVKVSDQSKTSGLPSEASIQIQLETVLQKQCGLIIAAGSAAFDAQIRFDLSLVPISIPNQKNQNTVGVVLARTSVWRNAAPLSSDGKTADTSNPNMMTAWILTTMTDLVVDPTLTATIANHLSSLEVAFQAVGQPPLPGQATAEFFRSRLPEMNAKLRSLIKQKLTAANPSLSSNIIPSLSLSDDGGLVYSLSGTISGPAPITPVGAAPPVVTIMPVPQELDLAALARLNSLSTAKLTFGSFTIGPTTVPPFTINLSDLFQ